MWKRYAEYLKLASVILRKKEDYSEQEITDFQSCIGILVQDWLVLQAEIEVTNHIHMLISRHVTENMIQFSYLY